jgi:hypothetical protein
LRPRPWWSCHGVVGGLGFDHSLGLASCCLVSLGDGGLGSIGLGGLTLIGLDVPR